MKKIATLALITLAGTAQAGSLAPSQPTPAVIVPAPVMPAPVVTGNWTGFYAGLNYSIGSMEAEVEGVTLDLLDIDGPGLHIGYMHDMGQWVLGGEFAYSSLTGKLSDDWADAIEVGGETSSDANFAALKARVGYDAGNFMPYGVLGFGKLEEDNISENATIVGIGAEYKINQNFSVGAEYTRNIFSDILSDELEAELGEDVPSLDATADLFSLRVSYHF